MRVDLLSGHDVVMVQGIGRHSAGLHQGPSCPHVLDCLLYQCDGQKVYGSYFRMLVLMQKVYGSCLHMFVLMSCEHLSRILLSARSGLSALSMPPATFSGH